VATTTANKVERWKVAPVDRSIDASSTPLGEAPATSGVQRLVVAEVPDGVGESEAMANSTHVLAMVLHDEHVVVVVVGVFAPVALHSVPSRVVPWPQVIAAATQEALPELDEYPVGHATQLLPLPFSPAYVLLEHGWHASAPSTSLNSPGLHRTHDTCPTSLWYCPIGHASQVAALTDEAVLNWPIWQSSHAPLAPVPAVPAPQGKQDALPELDDHPSGQFLH
jgi:hypothetical protein